MAKSLFAVFSFGRFAHLVARAIGWSPVAKAILISGVEGPEAHLFTGVRAVVRSVDERGMVVELAKDLNRVWDAGTRLRLTARHSGWTPLSLCLCSIAVVVEVETPGGQSTAIAIAIVKLAAGA